MVHYAETHGEREQQLRTFDARRVVRDGSSAEVEAQLPEEQEILGFELDLDGIAPSRR